MSLQNSRKWHADVHRLIMRTRRKIKVIRRVMKLVRKQKNVCAPYGPATMEISNDLASEKNNRACAQLRGLSGAV